MCFQKGLCCFEKSSSSRVHIAEHSMSSWEGCTPLVAKVSESLSVCLLFSMALFFSPFKEAVSWCKVRNSLDGIVPRNILLRSVMTCWVLRRKQVFSWHWRNPHPFWCSASCCDISVPMLGTPLGAMCLCAPCALSIHFSLSFSEKECSSVLPQCSSCMLFFVRRICCCSSESLKHLCSCSKFSSCCWLSPPWILGFGLFESVRVLSQGRPSWCHPCGSAQ